MLRLLFVCDGIREPCVRCNHSFWHTSLELFSSFVLWGFPLGLISFPRTTFLFAISSFARVLIISILFGFVCGSLFGFVSLARLFLDDTGHLIDLMVSCCLRDELLILESSLISSTLASDSPAVDSSCYISTGNFPKRNVSTDSVVWSPNACAAVFFRGFRKSENNQNLVDPI